MNEILHFFDTKITSKTKMMNNLLFLAILNISPTILSLYNIRRPVRTRYNGRDRRSNNHSLHPYFLRSSKHIQSPFNCRIQKLLLQTINPIASKSL